MVHWAEAPQSVPVTLRLGDVMPLLTSATGRCFAAFMGSEGRDAQRIAPMIRDELARAVIARQDMTFIDPTAAAVAGVSPASITNLVRLKPHPKVKANAHAPAAAAAKSSAARAARLNPTGGLSYP
jgi:hypothetical protein